MHKLSKSQFKPRALEIFREIESSGRALVITDNGRPVLEIRPYRPLHPDPLEKLRGSVMFFQESQDRDEFFNWGEGRL